MNVPRAIQSEPVSYEELPDFLTMKELRQYLRIGANTAYEWVNRPDFPKVSYGNRNVFPKGMVKEWAEQQALHNIRPKKMRAL